MAANTNLIPPYKYEGPQQNQSQPASYGQNLPYGQNTSYPPPPTQPPPSATPQPYTVSPMTSPAFNQSVNPPYNAYNPSAFAGPPQPYGNPMNKQQQQQQAFAPPPNAPPTPQYTPTSASRPVSVIGTPFFPPPPGRRQSSYFPPPANVPPTPQYTPTSYGQPALSPQSTGSSYFPRQPQNPPIAPQQPYRANSITQAPYGQPILTPQSTGATISSFGDPPSPPSPLAPQTAPGPDQLVHGVEGLHIELPAVGTPVSAAENKGQGVSAFQPPSQPPVQENVITPVQDLQQIPVTSPTQGATPTQDRQAPQIQQPQPIQPSVTAQSAFAQPPPTPYGQPPSSQPQFTPPPNTAPPQIGNPGPPPTLYGQPGTYQRPVPPPPNSAPPQNRDSTQFIQPQCAPETTYQPAQSTIYGYNSIGQQPPPPPPYSPPTQPLQNPPQFKHEYQPQSPYGQTQPLPQSPPIPQPYGVPPQAPQPYGQPPPPPPQGYGIQDQKQQYQNQIQHPVEAQNQVQPPLYSHPPGMQVVSQQQQQTSVQQLGQQYGIPVQQTPPQQHQPGKDEHQTGKAKRFFGDTLVGRFARSSVSTVTTTIKMPSVLSPWGDNNPVTLPNVRYRDAVLFGTFAVIGAPLVDGVVDGVASSFGADHFISEIVSSGGGFITGNTIVKYGVFQVVEQAIDKGVLEKVLPEVEKTMRTTSAKTLQVSIKHKLMGVDADIQFVRTYPTTNMMACDKGWFSPYLFASSRTPMIPRNQDWAMAQFFRPYLAGESAGMWSSSRRPGCGSLRIHLLNGCPSIVVPCLKEKTPVMAWSPWTVNQMQNAMTPGAKGNYSPQRHHEEISSYILGLVDRNGLLEQVKVPGVFERLLGKGVQMVMNGAINAPRSMGKVVGCVDGDRAGIVCLRY
ncbi:uncharacterized protein KY384_002347 [Bacidia gigantensis]|uniref:uncharacterized protein n=1 Tax=Bacidia gigantensis TaxID=2732470 RepID=UPI001D058B36|nr:uncharacterized protein KY384_002347 [Bacidia gigantensis]KAG8532470.1 hypothetical protein KY384_002347 [Bacidia gigantensis]